MKKVIAALITCSLLFATHMLPAQAADPKSPYGTLAVDPAGPTEIILTLSKGSRQAEFAYGRLLKMKSSVITINEPFIKKRQSFTVIPLSRLFALVGIKDTDMVTTTALNDYIFKDRAKNFLKANAYLAIKKNGKAIGYDEGGPIRLIYSDSSSWANYLDSWNWSLVSISVK
jgi:hypothetical protein